MKNKIVNIIQKMAGKYPPEEIFSDWVTCSSLAFQNPLFIIRNAVWQQREEQYIRIAKKYSSKELQEFVRMLNLLIQAFEKEIADILGEIYMEAGCGNKRTGQFFTPFHISKITARCIFAGKVFHEDEKYEMHEPSVGAGGMIIAVAAVLKERGMNYQKIMKVTAQDLDWCSVHMAHLQFSLLGIDAVVAQGDTLLEPNVTDERRIFRTPRNMGVL